MRFSVIMKFDIVGSCLTFTFQFTLPTIIRYLPTTIICFPTIMHFIIGFIFTLGHLKM